MILEYTETLRENRESTSGFRTKLAYMMKSAPGPVAGLYETGTIDLKLVQM